MGGCYVEINDRRTFPRLQVEAPEVMLEGQLAMPHDDDACRLACFHSSNLATSADNLLPSIPTLPGVDTSHLSSLAISVTHWCPCVDAS
jgi:hypothetical protein